MWSSFLEFPGATFLSRLELKKEKIPWGLGGGLNNPLYTWEFSYRGERMVHGVKTSMGDFSNGVNGEY